MKRWLITALLALAVLVFIAPGLIGLIAERTAERQFRSATPGSVSPDLRQLAFDRGWFTSEGKHRLAITDPDLSEFIAIATPGGGLSDTPVALVVDSRVDHGVIPVGTTTRPDGASLLPALATGVSTLAVELPDGRLVPLPGVLHSRVGLTGGLELDFKLPAGNETRGEARVAWQAAELAFGVSNDGEELSFKADIGTTRFENAWQSFEIADAQIAANGEATAAGIIVGDASVVVEGYDSNYGPLTDSFRRLDLQASSSLEREAVRAVLDVELLGLDTAEGLMDIALSMNADDLQAAALATLLRKLQYALEQQRPLNDELFADIDVDLRRVLSRGATVNIEELLVRTPPGDMLALIDLALPEQDDVATWPGLLLALDASIDLEVDRGRANAESPIRQTLQRTIASGFLVLDGDVYRMRVEYSKGRATVNGAPLQISEEMFQ